MASHPRGSPRTFRVQLRPEARTAAFMLATTQHQAEISRKNRGLRYWLNDLVDAFSCEKFKEVFGISVTEFLQRVRARVPKSRRRKYVPRDASLQRSAQRLLTRQYQLARVQAGSAGTSEAR